MRAFPFMHFYLAQALLASTSLTLLATAQSFPQQSNWREPSITLDYGSRASLAENALSSLASQIDYSSGRTSALDIDQDATLLYTMAEYDRRHGSSVFVTNVTTALQNYVLAQNWSDTAWPLNSDRLRWGLAYLAAYRAYPDNSQHEFFLDRAQGCWDASQAIFVSADAASKGSIPGLPPGFNLPFESTCTPLNGGQPVTTAGAIFWRNGNYTEINGETIGPWIALSSSLYASHLDSKYSSAANLSIQFVMNFLSNGTAIFDTYQIQQCALTSSGTFTYNAGYILHGLSTYYTNVTSASDQELSYLNELAASLILNPGWTGSNGVNYDDQIKSTTPDLTQYQLTADWKAIFVSGLYDCLAAGLLNETVANLTQQYISVQFNAVRELANYTVSEMNGEVYSPSWVGSPAPLQQYSAFGQLAAAELFTTSLGIQPNGSSSNSSGSPPSQATPPATSSQPPKKTSSVGAIVGGVVGGAVATVGVLVGALYWRRRRRRQHAAELNRAEELPSGTVPEPYIIQTEGYTDSQPTSTSAQADGSYGSRTKRQPLQYVRAVSDPSVPGESQSPLESLMPPGLQNEGRVTEGGRAGMVSVDAGALQRLLMGIGGALSDMQRRERHDGTNESTAPPDYEDSA